MTDLIKEAQQFLDYANGNDGCGQSHAERTEEINRSTTKMLMMIKGLIENHHNQCGEIKCLKKRLEAHEERLSTITHRLEKFIASNKPINPNMLDDGHALGKWRGLSEALAILTGE